MFLHLGRDVAVAEDSIIVVFDMDTATWSRHTRNYLTAAEKALERLVEILLHQAEVFHELALHLALVILRALFPLR